MSDEQVARQTVATLFEGITVSSDLKRAADSIVVGAIASMTRLGPGPDRGVKMKQIRDARDFDLRALLTSESDKKIFDENLRNMSAEKRPPMPRTD